MQNRRRTSLINSTLVSLQMKILHYHLWKINPSKATGPDLIPMRVLKEAASAIAPFLCFIFQKSIDTGSVPADWKHANIIAVYKKGSRTAANNYRPVSLTSVPCKLLEHIMFRHIMTHLDAHNVLEDHQHGFRSNRSCETQLINTIEHLARSMNYRNQTDLLILDFSKAFDTVAHKRLLMKLDYYGIRGHHLNWMRSWLLNRTQQVVLEGEHSENSNVKWGVPQGKVLGPLCFLLYINDIGNNISSNLKLFADDTLLYGLIHNANDALHLERDLDSLVTWAQEWQMNFNPSKCYVLRIYRIKNPIIHQYTMLGQTLRAVDHQPYLDITISETLNWETHVLQVKNKANKTLGCIKRNLHSCPERVKAQAYTSLVRPILEYGSTAWDPYRIYQKNWLEQVQRRAARFVTKTYSRQEGCVTQALNHLNWPTLEHRRKVNRLTLMYKTLHGQAAINIPPYVKHKTVLKTRNSNPMKFIPLQTSCDEYKYSFWPRTINDWNSLPPNIINMTSISNFKTAVNNYVLI